jgi:hypothetical protein
LYTVVEIYGLSFLVGVKAGTTDGNIDVEEVAQRVRWSCRNRFAGLALLK